MTEMFTAELREQLARAREDLNAARADHDDEGVQAHEGRVSGILHTAAHHGIDLPHSPDEEGDG